MDVDDAPPAIAAVPKFQLFAPLKPTFVAPPSSPADLHSTWTAETATQPHIIKFLARWPPSRTSFEYGPWIVGDRGGQRPSAPPDIAGLQAAFQALVAADTVSVETVDEIAKAHNVLAGKWMVFQESGKIDVLWGKVLYHVCTERQKGLAKVSTWKEGEKHVICVYVDDYTDAEEVGALRKALRKVGVKWKIGFKPDAYTHLNIYKDNPWKLRPSRFNE
ncbi:translation initiation factor eIF 4e-like domain-containing protein [Pholiota molesta]|nr:translation initiation factor eIF 4e-like domain-containing protein [Pholiota molesta]